MTRAALIPRGGQPLTNPADVAALRDDSPAARKRWAELQSQWETAPLRQNLNGARVRLSGFALPLEGHALGMTEFLLVPYCGACIHSPPPPANQIVWVRLQQPLPHLGSLEAVEVSGRLVVERQRATLATSGYRLDEATAGKAAR